jgi:transcription initiation factor TFIIIB Brf1 subunit/transcription initiation factor TFIIB
MSAAVMAACKLVLERKVVVRGTPFHWIAEEEMKLVPVTVSVNAASPDRTVLGLSDVAAGTGLPIVNVSGLEVPPPGTGVVTVTMALPAVAISAAVTAACKLVLETNVVVRALPFHWIVEEETKLDPVTVSVNAAPPAPAKLGFSDVAVGDGLLSVNVSGLEVPPPGAGVETVTVPVPAVATSAAVMAACKLVVETKVVVRGLPFHWTFEEEMKLLPVTVSVNAAPPAAAELGFSEPFASDGTGLFVVPELLGRPLHPESHAETAKHTTNSATTKLEDPGRNRDQMFPDTVLKERLRVLIAPPRVELVVDRLVPIVHEAYLSPDSYLSLG